MDYAYTCLLLYVLLIEAYMYNKPLVDIYKYIRTVKYAAASTTFVKSFYLLYSNKLCLCNSHVIDSNIFYLIYSTLHKMRFSN